MWAELYRSRFAEDFTSLFDARRPVVDVDLDSIRYRMADPGSLNGFDDDSGKPSETCQAFSMK